MDLSTIEPLYSVSGFAVGVLVGLTGVGGGSLMTPLLVLLFGIHPATAVGTDLLYASITKSAGTLVHGFNRTIDWRVTGLLAAGSVPAAFLTIWALAHVGDHARLGKMIAVVLGYALIVTAVTLIFRHRILDFARRFGKPSSPARTAVFTVATGAILGIIVSMSSVGAGALGVTALFLLYPHLPTARIVGSDITHAVPLTFAAGMGHWLIGSVDWQLLISLLIGSIPGIIIGSQLAPRIPEALLRSVLAGTLTAVGVKLALT